MWFLLGAAVGAAYLLVVGLLLSRRPATAVEARLAVATSGQADVGTAAASAWPDLVAGHQLAWIGLILDPGRTGAIIDIARATALLLALAAVLLIFPIARRLEFPRALAAAAAAGTAVACGLVLLYGGINSGTLALVWLSAAALLAVSTARYARTAALAAAGVAVVCAPLVAVGVLVLGAHLVAVCAVAPGLSDRTRRLIVAALVSGAAVVAVLATGGRPLAPASAPDFVLPLAVPIIACSAVIIGLAWWRADWLRPVCTAVAALLACGLLPGAGLATAATLAAPVIVLLGIAVLDTIRVETPGLALVAAVGLLAASPAIGFPSGGHSGAWTSLSDWMVRELEPGRVVLADELTGAQLVRDGIPASRLRSLSDPSPPAGAIVVLVDRPGEPAADVGLGSPPLARFADGPGHADSEVRLAEVEPLGALQAELDDRTRFGAALAANDAMRWTPEAVAALRAGRVDPRLMTVLAGLTAAHRITVSQLPTAAGEPPDAPRRTAVITEFDGASTADPANAPALRQWLERQLPPYDPLVTAQAGQPLRVGFPAPTPFGLIPG